MRLIGGTSNPDLTRKIAMHLGVPLMDAQIGRFPDGEVNVDILDNVEGEDVFLVQSMSPPVNDQTMELLVTLGALRQRGARRLIAVIPYLSYARQDHVSDVKTSISAKIIAKLLSAAGADHVLTLDLHVEQNAGYFADLVDNLFTTDLFSGHIREHYGYGNDVLVVSPDLGGVARARRVAHNLGAELVVIEKHREGMGTSRLTSDLGDISCKKCILIDDIVDSAYTLCNAAEVMNRAGAVSVTAYVTHGILSDGALTRLRSSPLDKVFMTDSIQANEKVAQFSKIERISVSLLLAKAMLRLNEEWLPFDCLDNPFKKAPLEAF